MLKKIHLYVEAKHDTALKKEAKFLGCSKSEVYRIMLTRFFNNKEEILPKVEEKSEIKNVYQGVVMPNYLSERLSNYCTKNGIKKSYLIRIAIIKLLNELEKVE